MKADALEIEAQAARKLADEYDAAHERGEVGKQGQRTDVIPSENKVASQKEAGVTAKEIFEARKIRDAEEADLGIVRSALDAMLERGEEPTRAGLKREIASPGFISELATI